VVEKHAEDEATVTRYLNSFKKVIGWHCLSTACESCDNGFCRSITVRCSSLVKIGMARWTLVIFGGVKTVVNCRLWCCAIFCLLSFVLRKCYLFIQNDELPSI
jgi:hypothetical protein